MGSWTTVVLDVAKLVVPPGLTFLFGMYIQRRREKTQREKEKCDEAAKESMRSRLVLAFDPKNAECVTPHRYNVPSPLSSASQSIERRTVTDSYVSVLVVNSGQTTAHNCHGYLIALYKRENGDWRQVAIGGRLPLIWAMDEKDVAIPNGCPKGLNILHANGAAKCVSLQVEGGMPDLIRSQFSSGGEFRFMITVDADDATPETIMIRATWSPETDGTWSEESLSLISEDPPPVNQ